MKRAHLFSLAIAAGMAIPCSAVIINVPTDQPSITAALAAAVNGDEIVVAPGTYFESGLNTAGKAITLRSSGGAAVTTISNAARMLIIDQGETATTIVDGFTFTGATGANTGAVGFIGNASPIIRNCIFTGNTTSTSGGAFQLSNFNFGATIASPSTMLFENCEFINNSATGTTSTRRGGALSIFGASPTIRNCTFTGNSSGRTGGAIGIVQGSGLGVGTLPVVIENCTFEANICNGAGGAPAINNSDRDLVITGSTFTNHTTTATVGGLAISHNGVAGPTLTLTNTSFTSHTGARPIISVTSAATINITGGSFSGNTAFSGCIQAVAPAASIINFSLSGTSITNNITTIGVSSNSPLITGSGDGFDTATITNLTATNNVCSAVVLANSTTALTITGGTISGNTGGGSMIVANPVTDCTISGVTFGPSGGLISASGPGDFELSNCTFTGCTSTAVSASNFTNILLTNSTFAGGNFNSSSGSVIIVTDSGGGGTGALTASDLVFSANAFNGSSARVVNLSSLASADLSGLQFTGNNSTGSSANILGITEVASATITGGSAVGNTTGSSGAVVSFTGPGDLSINGSVITDNNSRAISITDAGNAAVVNCTVDRNRSGLGASAAAAPSLITVTGSSFRGGTSNGGAAAGISINEAAAATITACKVQGNIDGGISLGGTEAHSIINTLITGSSGSNGGGISVAESASVSIINCTVADNGNVGGTPGGLWLNDSASATVVNSIFYGNPAPEIDGSASTGTLAVTFSDVQGGFVGVGNFDIAPAFVDANGADNIAHTADDDYRLASGSAGIGAGSNAGVPSGVTTDLGGLPRIVATVDTGAHEFQGAACPLDLSNNGTVDADDIFAFLNIWFAGPPGGTCTGCTADWNNDGLISADDIFAFLNAWFAFGPGNPCP